MILISISVDSFFFVFFALQREDNNRQRFWNSAVWPSPPNFRYSQGDQSTNVVVPPLTLPQWNQITSDSDPSDLLSPTKNLLPASANPLNPRTSPYFSARNAVVAPHPSELPFPSLSLTPKKSALAEIIELHKNNGSNTDLDAIEEGADSSETYSNGRSTPGKQHCKY